MRNTPPRILLIGPTPPPTGGATVAFESLARSLSGRSEVAVRVVRTTGIRGGGVGGGFRAFAFLRSLFSGARWADVVGLHLSNTGLHVLGPAVAGVCRVTGTPLVVRRFGGADLMVGGPLRRALVRWTLRRTGVYLAETKGQVDQAVGAGVGQVRWYPNSRCMPELPEPDAPGESRRCSRFVFLGQVRGCKGVPEIIQAGESLDERLVVDVYGPLGFGIRESAFSGRVRYRGVVDRDDVPAILSTYHALVLPSYYEGEGYPGVVIEAFAAGIPVVCTRWRALPELVDESCGILVAPRDAEELRDAMNALGRDSELYARLKAGVRRRREEFSDEVWHQRYVQYCLELASVGAGRGRRTRP